MIVWLIAVKGQYKSVEKVFLAASFFYITYVFAGVLAKPAWIEAVKATMQPPGMAAFRQGTVSLHGHWRCRNYDRALDAVLFAVVDCGERGHAAAVQNFAARCDCGLHLHRVVAWFIVVACAATLYLHGNRDIRDAADAAQSLRPLAGDWAYILFALGPFQCVAVRGFDSAAFDGLHGL